MNIYLDGLAEGAYRKVALHELEELERMLEGSSNNSFTNTNQQLWEEEE